MGKTNGASTTKGKAKDTKDTKDTKDKERSSSGAAKAVAKKPTPAPAAPEVVYKSPFPAEEISKWRRLSSL